jgi:hypothetical protein
MHLVLIGFTRRRGAYWRSATSQGGPPPRVSDVTSERKQLLGVAVEQQPTAYSIPFGQATSSSSTTINLCTINLTIALRLPLGKKISTHTTSHVSASRSRPRCSADRGSDLERDPDHSALGSPPHCTPKPSHPTSQRCRLHTTHRGISTSRRSGCRSTPGGPTSDP